jgi:hypothetical protein
MKPTRSNPFAWHTFTELCVMLNAEYHHGTAYRDSRMIQIMEEIVFRTSEKRQLETKEVV